MALEALEILRSLASGPKSLEDLARELVPSVYRSAEDLRKDLLLLQVLGLVMPLPNDSGRFRLSEKASRWLRNGRKAR